MSSDRIAVIDVETTGLSPWRHDRVVEIAIVVISPDGSVENEYETLVNPQRDMGPTSIHRITSSDIADAPTFRDIAGDVLQILQGATVVSGHNVSFDRNFVVKEFDRLGATLPEFPALCTCRHFGRSSLEACCRDLGITLADEMHRALTDARATAKLVSTLVDEDHTLLESYRIRDLQWPSIPVLKTPCHRREHAAAIRSKPPQFLQKLAERIHHNTEATLPDVLAYMTLLDRVLEDRAIDRDEEELLVEAATNWKLSSGQVSVAHTQYLHNLAVVALADGIITDSERRDLHVVAQLLGLAVTDIDAMLNKASLQLTTARKRSSVPTSGNDLAGKRVCFTGELQATLSGEPITRELAETLAIQGGLKVASSVTKSLDILVVADPNTQSSKARKARDYGIRILSDSVFWRLAGINVD